MFPRLKGQFDLRTYDPANPETTYNEFIEGKGGHKGSFKPIPNINVWKILPRGRSTAADRLLNWLVCFHS
jgi:hypothetical protein